MPSKDGVKEKYLLCEVTSYPTESLLYGVVFWIISLSFLWVPAAVLLWLRPKNEKLIYTLMIMPAVPIVIAALFTFMHLTGNASKSCIRGRMADNWYCRGGDQTTAGTALVMFSCFVLPLLFGAAYLYGWKIITSKKKLSKHHANQP